MIYKLDDQTINFIKSGESIETLSSIIIELIENSIDANSKNIIIKLTDYGKYCINVIDDGDGMCEYDAKICFENHTTSKIKKYSDIIKIKSFGFKGEALHNICSISKCCITTRDSNSSVGTQLIIKNNKIINIEHVCSKKGTNIKIFDIFYNIPQKKKYLKNNSLELNETIKYINELYLSNNINISLYNDNKKIISYHYISPFDSIIDVFGPNIAKNMIKLKENNNNCIKINGYISDLNHYSSNSENIYVIINNKPIKLLWIKKLIMESYNSFLLKNKYPFLILYISIPIEFIDLNATPYKNIIKFENEE